MTRCFESGSEEETEALGERLARRLDGDGVVLLLGDLGSGKTVLVRGMARALSVDRREIQSPSYTLIHEHQGIGGRLVHVDLYRLEGAEVDALGLDELLAAPGLVAVEWAERLDPALLPAGRPVVRVRIERSAGGRRQVHCTSLT